MSLTGAVCTASITGAARVLLLACRSLLRRSPRCLAGAIAAAAVALVIGWPGRPPLTATRARGRRAGRGRDRGAARRAPRRGGPPSRADPTGDHRPRAASGPGRPRHPSARPDPRRPARRVAGAPSAPQQPAARRRQLEGRLEGPVMSDRRPLLPVWRRVEGRRCAPDGRAPPHRRRATGGHRDHRVRQQPARSPARSTCCGSSRSSSRPPIPPVRRGGGRVTATADTPRRARRRARIAAISGLVFAVLFVVALVLVHRAPNARRPRRDLRGVLRGRRRPALRRRRALPRPVRRASRSCGT